MTVAIGSNGLHPYDGDVVAEAEQTGARTLAALRTTPQNVHLLRGYGPLVVGIVLFLLMVTLAPTVAPEHVVERPAATTTTTATPDPGPATTAPAGQP
jgi:hypothetical protein